MSHARNKPRSRRELVAGLVGGSIPQQDRRVLLQLLDLEYLARYVYSLAAVSPHVSSAGQALARKLQGQEGAHAAALSRLTGPGAPGGPSFSASAAEAALAGHGITVTFSSLGSERAWFTLLERLESALEGAYYKSLGRLIRPASVTLAARVLASEAQHSTLLFSFRNPQDIGLNVAEALVTGSAGQPSVASSH